MKHTRRLAIVFSGAAFMAATFAGGMWVGANQERSRAEWVEGRIISSAIDSVRANALDSLPSEELVRRAVSGMLRELHDPYAAMLRPESYERYKGSLQGEGRGLGVSFRRQAGTTTINNVVKGSPAWESGIRAGDRVISVNNVPVAHLWNAKDSTLRRSDTVRFELYRAAQNDTVVRTALRTRWHMPAVPDGAMLADGVGYVHLTTVSERAAEELEEQVEELIERGAHSLMLDLRGNGGGLFEEGVRVASLFLPRGATVASLASRSDAEVKVHTVRRTRWPNLPLVVLVDEQTASAAELIAAAMRDHRRALLVGKRTYGKGVVQRVVKLSPDIALRLTTARWLTPSGESLELRKGTGEQATGGIVPDVFVDAIPGLDPFSVPNGYSAASVEKLLLAADSAAAVALREKWRTDSLPVLEARMRARVQSLAPRKGTSATSRATWVGMGTRMAVARYLEVSSNHDALLRYRARQDNMVRAALDVIVPGSQALAVNITEPRRPKATRIVQAEDRATEDSAR